MHGPWIILTFTLYCKNDSWAGIAQSVWQLATVWTVRESNPDVGEIFRTCPDLPWVPPSLLYNTYRVFPGGKAAGGVALTNHPI
jgi:hypothetical protein